MAAPATIVFASALVASLVLTALMRRVAPRLGLTDRPDGHRKLHGQATPLGGGAAVFLATTLVLAVLFVMPNRWSGKFDWHTSELVALLLASTVIVLLGLVDDRVGIRGRQKFFGQFLAISVLVAGGLVIQRIALFGWQIDLGLLAVPLTYFWLLGAINSVNLLDGMDGLASLLGIILVATFAALAMIVGHYEVAIVALAFAGALCGFMRYNFPPATIFLGDAGSMLIGLVVGVLAIHGSLKGPGTVLLAVPLAVWTLPILDSSAAVLRRKLSGRSIYSIDRGHLHHRLKERLGSNRKVLASVAVCCVATSAAATASVLLKTDLVAVVVCLAVVVILAASGLFGRAEFALLYAHVRRLGRSLAPSLAGARAPTGKAVHVQGSGPWDPLWMALTESADRLLLQRIQLNVNLPMVQEAFDARWESPVLPDAETSWKMDVPLMVSHHAVGRLTVVGQQNGKPLAGHLAPLLELIESIESQVQSIAEAAGRQSTSDPSDAPSPPDTSLRQPVRVMG